MFELYGIPFEGQKELVARFAFEDWAEDYVEKSKLANAPFNRSNPSKARWEAGQAYVYRASSVLRNYIDCCVCARKEVPSNPHPNISIHRHGRGCE